MISSALNIHQEATESKAGWSEETNVGKNEESWEG